MSEPELEITIDAAVFDAAVARFKASCVSLLDDHADTPVSYTHLTLPTNREV